MLTLSDGTRCPRVGFGTYQRKDVYDVETAVLSALAMGYRSIDCASYYKNEAEVGRAIAASGVPREELYITSKVWNDYQGADRCLESFRRSLEALGCGYLDTYLVHWPVEGVHAETYVALQVSMVLLLVLLLVLLRMLVLTSQLQGLVASGEVKSLGLSNYTIEAYEELVAAPGFAVAPVSNQLEVNVCLFRAKTIEYFQGKGVAITAYKPFGGDAALLGHETVVRIGAAHGCSAAQVAIRFLAQQDIAVIPKSKSEERMKANLDAAAPEVLMLTAEEMAELKGLTDEGAEAAYAAHFASRRNQHYPADAEQFDSWAV